MQRYRVIRGVLGDSFEVKDSDGEPWLEIAAGHVRDVRLDEKPIDIDSKRDKDREARVIKGHKLKATVIHTPGLALNSRFTVEMPHGKDINAEGNVLDHEYRLTRDGDTIATISKDFFNLRDVYGVEVENDDEATLIVTVAVCIDMLAHGDAATGG